MKQYELIGMNVASSKNSKRIVRGRLINSKLAMDYYNFVIPKLEYIRKDRRHFDYCNVVQILADAFQKVGILEDDDMNHFVPVFDGYEVNGDNPGVKFWVD